MNDLEPKDRPQQQRQTTGREPEQQPPSNKRFAPPWVWLLLAVIFFGLFYAITSEPGQGERISTWSDFKEIVRDGGIRSKSITVKNERVEAVVKADYETQQLDRTEGEATSVYVSIDEENRDFYLQQLESLGVAYSVDTSSDMFWPILLGWLPILLLIGIIIFFVVRARQASQAGPMGMLGNFGRSQHRVASKDQVNVTLDDIAGIEEAKAEVQEVIEFLQNPERFRKIGARVPRGALLLGPPGSGKTLLARAIAGEADVPFFSISGSDFMEMFVGVGARRVRDLFAQAKHNEPCIIFLDEIDAVGRKRGFDIMGGGGHGEREQTLNAILSEMDGFEPHDEVIVIAATNRPEVLDPALVRPGRFDRQVNVPLPDIRGRRQILRIHARQVKLADDVNLEDVARATPMFSGADLAALVNEAAIIAAMKDSDRVEMQDFRQARDKVRFGRAQTSRKLDEQQRIVSAYHEAGHALLQSLLEDTDPVEKVTIIPRGRAMGGTFALPEKDRYGFGRKYLLATLRILCAGRIAEKRKTDDVSTGAQDDIHKASELTRQMVCEWGMSERLGFIRLASDESQERVVAEKGYSEETAAKIDEEVRRIVDEAYRDAEQIIEENWHGVEAIAQALLEHETITADDIERLLRSEQLPAHA